MSMCLSPLFYSHLLLHATQARNILILRVSVELILVSIRPVALYSATWSHFESSGFKLALVGDGAWSNRLSVLLLDLALCAIAVKKGYFHPQSFGRASTGLHPLVPMGLCLLGNKKILIESFYLDPIRSPLELHA
ncbi:hypothetical protein OUZ56_026308 [Daphnia magna]|uniref:Uncharacterized protein n=1 Tax=Daphnia magna TaxID=35525 RepID=A0ABQ9ZLD4_9CRUS|nr:hypothetical protein OUZ56_026308 [Daphnia magna]